MVKIVIFKRFIALPIHSHWTSWLLFVLKISIILKEIGISLQVVKVYYQSFK